MRRAMFGAALLFTVTACHDPDAYRLGPDLADKVLAVSVSAQAIPADGISRTIVTAQLDPFTDADKRVVSFTTSAGTLIGGGKEGPSTTVAADTTGKAIVELRSATTPGLARLDVSAGTVSRSLSVEFSTVPTQELFDVALDRTAIPADGFSTAQVTVTLKRLGTPQQRLVKFDATAGTLLAAGANGPHQANVPADSNGIAAVELQSDKSVTTSRITITALDATREIAISFVAADPRRIITLSAVPSSAPADGATPVLLTARVAAELPSERRSVTFRTTLGTFLSGNQDEFTVDADGSNAARATLVSTTIGAAEVTATVDGTTSDTKVEFAEALPDSIFVALDAATLRSGEHTLVTATLLRNVGDVTPKLQANYVAFTSTGISIGLFSGATLSDGGVSTATFNVGATSYTGTVTIRVSVNGVTGVGTLEIVP